MKKILFLFIGLLLLTACTDNSDGKRFKAEYEELNTLKEESGEYKYRKMELSSNNPIKYLEMDELFDFFENGTGFIYLGRPACPWCRISIPVLFEAADKYNMDTIYYYDIEKIRNDNTNDYKKLVEVLYDYLPIDTVTQKEEDEGFDPTLKRIVVPAYFSLKEGKIVDYHQNTVSSHESYEVDFTEEQNDELISIFERMYKKTK